MKVKDAMIYYTVEDIYTREVVGIYSTRKRARSKADRLDLEYGAIRYIVRTSW